jgi:hypothetical protein
VCGFVALLHTPYHGPEIERNGKRPWIAVPGSHRDDDDDDDDDGITVRLGWGGMSLSIDRSLPIVMPVSFAWHDGR